MSLAGLLRIRRTGCHAKCSECELYKKALRAGTLSLQARARVMERYTTHIVEQWLDRQVYENMQDLSSIFKANELRELVLGDEVKDKMFELELSWVGEFSNGVHQRVPEDVHAEAERFAKAALGEQKLKKIFIS